MSNQRELMVSVVIPVYNIEGYVGQMLECVARQTWQSMEVIVINDGSTDATLQEVEKREKLFRNIKIINIPNGGVSNARNIGIKHVGGAKYSSGMAMTRWNQTPLNAASGLLSHIK